MILDCIFSVTVGAAVGAAVGSVGAVGAAVGSVGAAVGSVGAAVGLVGSVGAVGLISVGMTKVFFILLSLSIFSVCSFSSKIFSKINNA